MAFISEKKRESLIKKINKSYGFRKFLMVLELILLIGFIVLSFVSAWEIHKGNDAWLWWDKNNILRPMGIIMLVYAAVIAVLGIIALILILTLKSPKSVTKDVTTLETSAIGGKKLSENSAEDYRDRTTSKKKKEKKAKK